MKDAAKSHTNDCCQEGMTTVCDDKKQLLGVFTDGDLRRALERAESNLYTDAVKTVMTTQAKTVLQM